jgi:hypothetical protein
VHFSNRMDAGARSVRAPAVEPQCAPETDERHYRQPASDTERLAIHAVFELVLRRKSVAAKALATQRDALLGGKYPALEPRLRDLASLRMQITRKTLAGPGPEGLESHL